MNLNPKYHVKLIARDKAHFYQVIKDGKEYEFPGTTGVLTIIGGEKTQKLIGWAINTSLERVKTVLSGYGSSQVILEPDLIEKIIKEARRRPKETFEAAGNYGTRMHKYCDMFINSMLTKQPLTNPPDTDLKNSVEAFLQWIETEKINILMAETPVASIKHRFGGTADFIFEKNGRFGIGDFKTSSFCAPEYALQVAAYGQAADETFDEIFSLGLIVRFDKLTPTYECKWVDDMSYSFAAFLAAKKLQSRMKQRAYKEKTAGEKEY